MLYKDENPIGTDNLADFWPRFNSCVDSDQTNEYVLFIDYSDPIEIGFLLF